jgi:hypothetical protein
VDAPVDVDDGSLVAVVVGAGPARLGAASVWSEHDTDATATTTATTMHARPNGRRRDLTIRDVPV